MLFKKHYPELDLARAIAITMVLLLHLNERVAFSLPENSYITRFINWGYNGVDLFFVLSGFLIGGQIIEENLEGTFSFRFFLIKRFWRIIPSYYFAILVYLVASSLLLNKFVLTDAEVRKDVFYHMVYLQNYFNAGIYTGIYWSLAVEEHFYILIPVILFLFVKYLKGYTLAFLSALIFLAFSIRAVLYDPSKDWWSYFSTPSHMRFDSLLFGVVAALLFIRYRDRLLALSKTHKALLFLIPLASFLLVFFIFDKRGTGYFNICWRFTLTGLLFAALILFSTAFSFSRYIPLKKFFGHIAKVSYTMYLYHILIMIVFVNFIASKYLNISKDKLTDYFMLFFFYYMAVLGVSSLIYLLIDRPCMRYRKKILMKREPPIDMRLQ